MKTNYQSMSTEELGNLCSDYYKDVHGIRPRYFSYDDREAIIACLESLDSYMESMKSTFEGRKRLRAEGWFIEETEEDKKARREEKRLIRERIRGPRLQTTMEAAFTKAFA